MANGRRSGRRADYTWIGVPLVRTVATTVQAVLGTLSAGLPGTVVRCRGSFLVQGIPNAALDDEICGIGIHKVTSSASAAGGASVPGPIDDDDSDWMFHQYVPLVSLLETVASPNAIGLNHRFDIDSKAMRKLKPDDVVAVIIQLATGEMASVQVSGGVRVLHAS